MEVVQVGRDFDGGQRTVEETEDMSPQVRVRLPSGHEELGTDWSSV